MADLFDTIFGGTDDSAQKEQILANRGARKEIEEQAGVAKEDVRSIFPVAQESRQQGFQGALDVLGQSVPQQIGAFQQGNVQAQQALLAGLPQIQNAILGNRVDLSGLQPQQVQFDPSFLQQQLPDFPQVAPRPAPEPIIERSVDPRTIIQQFGGRGRGLGRTDSVPRVQRRRGRG